MALYRLKDSPYWWVSLVDPRTGRRIRKSTRLTDKAKAKVFEEQVRASLILGQHHYALQETERSPAWQQATQRWLKETSNKRDHVNDQIRIAWLKPHLNDKPLNEITAAVIHQVGELKAAQTSLATANRVLTLIRAVLRRAHQQWGWLDKVPHIRLYKESERRIRYLTKEEARKLLNELPPHLQDMTLFSLSTGLRASNVTGLRWSQVDLQRNHVWIHADQAKAGKALAVPLNSVAREVIVRQVGKNEIFVFTFESQPVTRPNNHAWRKALRRAGIGDFRWHDLRHTWASWHIQAGTPLHVLQELGGWSSYEMVRRYAHLSSDHLHHYSQQIAGLDLLAAPRSD
jgi:integrase